MALKKGKQGKNAEKNIKSNNKPAPQNAGKKPSQGEQNTPLRNRPQRPPQNVSEKVPPVSDSKQRPANSAQDGRPQQRSHSYESQSGQLKNASAEKKNASANNAASTRNRPPKKKKYRGGNYALYYVMGAVVLVIVFIVLANTVLFNCTQISVSGNEKYTSEEIIARSGLNIGDNLLRMNTSSARENIIGSLAYVDDVKIKRSFPTKVNIIVAEAVKQYCIVENGTTAAISRKGKIVEHCDAGDLPVVKGYEAETLEVGKWLSSKTEGKSEIPDVIFSAADAAGLKGITVVDMSDKFSVNITVEDRIILELGPAEDVKSKLLVAVKLINEEIGKEEYVTLRLTNPEKVPVHNNSLPRPSKPVSSSSVNSSSMSSQSVADPEPTPTPEPEPDPDPDPEPDPDPDPEPEPEPDPDPEPTPDPEPNPDPPEE